MVSFRIPARTSGPPSPVHDACAADRREPPDSHDCIMLQHIPRLNFRWTAGAAAGRTPEAVCPSFSALSSRSHSETVEAAAPDAAGSAGGAACDGAVDTAFSCRRGRSGAEGRAAAVPALAVGGGVAATTPSEMVAPDAPCPLPVGNDAAAAGATGAASWAGALGTGSGLSGGSVIAGEKNGRQTTTTAITTASAARAASHASPPAGMRAGSPGSKLATRGASPASPSSSPLRSATIAASASPTSRA